MKKHDIGFSGFLDGYKAQNIATTSSAAEFHFGQIAKQAKVLEGILPDSSSQNIFHFIHEKSELQKPTESLGALGEAIKTVIATNVNNQRNELIASDDFKKLVYHFLELAELSRDNSILDLAIDVGNLFRKCLTRT